MGFVAEVLSPVAIKQSDLFLLRFIVVLLRPAIKNYT